MGSQTLAGKRAVITGAGSGIGAAVAVAFAHAGASVALIGRRRDRLDETAARVSAIGGRSLVLPTDVSVESEVALAYDRAEAELGGLDTIVGVAGIELYRAGGDDRVDRLELKHWQRTIDTNLTGMFLTCKYGVRALLRNGGGSVIITGSPTAIRGHAHEQVAYSASKAGTHGLVRVMASELAPERIRVNCVIPGFVQTPLTAQSFADQGALARALTRIPLGRAGQPAEIAPIFVWLASDDASYATGAFFTVDGGRTAS